MGGAWMSARHSWLCCLLHGLRIILRRADWPDNTFYFSLGDYAGIGGIGWPLTESTVDNDSYYVLDGRINQSDLRALFILDPDAWEACAVEPLSPLGMAAESGDRLNCHFKLKAIPCQPL